MDSLQHKREEALSRSYQPLANALADRYRIERALGQGGMATVYLAHDIKHDRKVAVKVLKPELAAVLGAERFVVEIKTTAALQHPHILPLFDSGTADGFLYYVMPYIEGETLRGKLNRETQFSVDEAVRITTQVADALDYAHRHGVIHRDIKPENILLHDGRPMVADFGIALAVSAAAGGRMTETGLSLGTPHYMSPEQATADKDITGRSDIYSLASVLYEMLTGNPPHTGASAQQIIMKIIAEPAEALTKYRKSVPPNVAAATARALEKVPADRFESAKAFATALNDPAFTAFRGTTPGPVQCDGRRWLGDRRTAVTLTLAAAAVVAAFAWRGRASSAPAREVVRFTIELDSTLGSVMSNEDSHGVPAVSPDGRTVAFSGRTNNSDLLIIRRLDQFDARVVPGGGRRPFFSPDGSWLGFIRDGDVWRMRVDGEPVPVGRFTYDSWYLTGVCWLPGGRIIATTFDGVRILPETGGEPVHLTRADSASGEVFWNPVPIDESRVLVTVRHPSKPARVAVLSVRNGERTLLPEIVVPPAFVAEDMIVFGRDPVRAVRFDRSTMGLIGAPISVPGVPANFGASAAGSLAWVDEASNLNELVWVSPGGRESGLGVAPGRYRWPRLSPNGTQLLHGIRDPSDPRYWLWMTDLRTGRRVRLGTYIGNTEPAWMPGGDRVIFAAGEPPSLGLLIQSADASKPPQVLYPGPLVSWPTDVSRDGKTVAFYAAQGSDADDVFFLNMADSAIRRMPLPGMQRGGRFSPDGRWFAYQSADGGKMEVHVQPWPALDAKWVVSQGGGTEPVWSHDGRRLFYRSGGRVLAVDVPSGRTFRSAPPREVLSGDWFSDLYGDQSWDVAADGRFLVMRQAAGSRVRVKVVRDWITEFRASLDGSATRTDATVR